jgi:hypothetical protein
MSERILVLNNNYILSISLSSYILECITSLWFSQKVQTQCKTVTQLKSAYLTG